VETARDGSFCRCRNGSPSGHFVPETMLTFGPGICPNAPNVNSPTATHSMNLAVHPPLTRMHPVPPDFHVGVPLNESR
jgi:hypothetical protein